MLDISSDIAFYDLVINKKNMYLKQKIIYDNHQFDDGILWRFMVLFY